MSLLLRRYEQLGEKFDPFKIEIRKSLRINILKISEKKLIERLRKEKVKLTKIPFLNFGYYYEADFSLGATPEYLQGYYYLQESASQIPSMILNPNENDLVLDMSAAPGGKTSQMAAYMNNKGSIIALDNNAARLESLRNNLERLGVMNTIIYKKDARFVSDLGLKFDKILLDAPCSGNFVVEPDWFDSKSLEGFKDRSRLQRELLKAAIKVLKPKGVLVYSTCTLEPEENEINVDWLLNKYDDLKLQAVSVDCGSSGLTKVFEKNLDSSISNCVRCWPHKTNTQGFFIAKIVRK